MLLPVPAICPPGLRAGARAGSPGAAGSGVGTEAGACTLTFSYPLHREKNATEGNATQGGEGRMMSQLAGRQAAIAAAAATLRNRKRRAPAAGGHAYGSRAGRRAGRPLAGRQVATALAGGQAGRRVGAPT